MKLRAFFERLPKDGWWLSSEGEIRRGNNGEMDDGRCQCPVSSIGNLPTCYYLDVAREEGINDKLAQTIACAADGDCDFAYERTVREKLLKHCGLPAGV